MSTIYRYRLTTVVKETRLNRGECKGNAAKRLVKDSDKNGRLLLTIFQTFEKNIISLFGSHVSESAKPRAASNLKQDTG